MGRSGGKNKKTPNTTHKTRSSLKKKFTLSVSSTGIDKEAKVSIDGSPAATISGSIEIQSGSKVVVSAGRANKGWRFSHWEGDPSISVKTKCIFTIKKDISLNAVYEENKDEKITRGPDSGHDLIDLVAPRKEDLKEKESEVIKALLFLEEGDREALLEEIENSSPGDLDKFLRANQISPETRGVLGAISPAVIAQVPKEITDPVDIVRWLRGDRSLIDMGLPGLEEAAQDISEAIKNGDKIAVFSDYDVDGIMAGEIIEGTLKEYGAGVCRGSASRGFGLSEDFVRKAAAEGCSTLITADCGSGSSDAVILAQNLGMKVIVSDHHDIDPGNPADHHLNPKLSMTNEEKEAYERGESNPDFNTGSQLAWKLAADIHWEMSGEVPESHYGEPLYLAGLGCRADGGNMINLENRAFFKGGQVPEGIAELAEQLGEASPDDISNLDQTQRVLNVSKKIDAIRQYDENGNVLNTESFSSETVSQAISSPDPGLRKAAREKLIRAHEHAMDLENIAAKEIRAQSKEDKAMIADDGRTIIRPTEDRRFSHAVLDDERFSGITRSSVQVLARQTRRPSIVFARSGTDSDGEPIYKFSAAPTSGQEVKIGSVKNLDRVKDLTKDIGGHAEVFAGTCRGENIDKLMEEINTWSENQDKILPDQAPSRNINRAWVGERKISSDAELKRAERGRDMLAPFTEVFHEEKHIAPGVSVQAEVVEIKDPSPSAPRTHWAKIKLPDGSEREVAVQTGLAAKMPIGEELEIALRLRSKSHSVSAFKPL